MIFLIYDLDTVLTKQIPHTTVTGALVTGKKNNGLTIYSESQKDPEALGTFTGDEFNSIIENNIVKQEAVVLQPVTKPKMFYDRVFNLNISG